MLEPTTFVGIDPGLGGGIAVLRSGGLLGSLHVVSAVRMPRTHREVYAVLLSAAGDGRSMAVVEQVHSSPQMGVTSAFTFGAGYGALLMALAVTGIPHAPVAPQRWQRAMGCLTGGDKNVTKSLALRMFGGVKVTHAVADALLIAAFCATKCRLGAGGAVVVPSYEKPPRKSKNEGFYR